MLIDKNFTKRLRTILDIQLDLAELESISASLKPTIKTLLENTKKKLNVLEQMLIKPPSTILEKLIQQQYTDLKTYFEVEFAKIDLSKIDGIEKIFVNEIQQSVLSIFSSPVNLPEELLRHENKDILFEKLLQKFGNSLNELNIKGPSCFISYAWGNAINERNVHQIAKRLVVAGIGVVLDIEHNRTNSIIQFIGRVYKEDFVLVMGSPLLKQKYEKPGDYGSYVQQELDNILVRIKERQDLQKHPKGTGVLKALIEGPHWNAFPDIFKPYPLDEADFTIQVYYHDKFLNLLSLLYVGNDKALEILKDIKAEFAQDCEQINQMKREELLQYQVRDMTTEQQAIVKQSVHQKLQEASAANRPNTYSPIFHNAAVSAAAPVAKPSSPPQNLPSPML